MHEVDEDLPRLGYVEPCEGESVSHYLGRLRRFKANSLPSAYSLGNLVKIGGTLARWEKLYFNPFPSSEELEALGKLIGVEASELSTMLPMKGKDNDEPMAETTKLWKTLRELQTYIENNTSFIRTIGNTSSDLERAFQLPLWN